MGINDIQVGQFFFHSIGWKVVPVVRVSNSLDDDYNEGGRVCVPFSDINTKYWYGKTEDAYTLPYVKDKIKDEFYDN